MVLSIKGHALEAKHLVLITSGYMSFGDDTRIYFYVLVWNRNSFPNETEYQPFTALSQSLSVL